MSKIISIVILAAIVLPLGAGLFILFRNEIEIREKVTGGYGLPVVFALILIFIILPVVVFLTAR